MDIIKVKVYCFLVLFVFSVVAVHGASIRYVSSKSGSDSGDGMNPASPVKTIQYAVDQADSGDDIYIATYEVVTVPLTTNTCVYTGAGTEVISLPDGKSLNLKGGYIFLSTAGTWQAGVVPSLVNGKNTRRCLLASMGDGDTNLVELLEFANGVASDGANIWAKRGGLQLIGTPIHNGTATGQGGGIYMSDVDFSVSLGSYSNLALPQMSGMLPIYSNSADYGGGIYLVGGYPLLTTVGLLDNQASSDGGGIYINGGMPSIVGGEIKNNSASGSGGGLYLTNSVARVGGMLITDNTALYGGGIYLAGPFAFSMETATLIANNYIRYNSATGGKGGGIFFNEANVGVVNNVIANNAATNGAAAYLKGSSPRFLENSIADNVGDTGLYVTHSTGEGRWVVVETWLGTYSNYVEGIPVPSQPTLTNSIISGHATGLYVENSGSTVLPNKVDMGYTIWWKNTTANIAGAGTVNHNNDIYDDPDYTGKGIPPADLTPYHLNTGSPAIDSGIEVGLTLPGTDILLDIDGQMRPSGDGMDIGADEVVTDPLSTWFVPIAISRTVKQMTAVTNIHNLLNSGTQNDTYKIATSDTKWSSTPSLSSVAIDAQNSTSITVVIYIPLGAGDGDTNITTITATSQTDNSKTAVAVDTTGISTTAGESKIHYVWQESATPTEPYATPNTAAHELQTAINISRDGDTVFVYPGSYDSGGGSAEGAALTNRVYVTNSVIVESMSGPDDTYIMGRADPVSTNGPGAVRGAYLQGGAKLLGFSVVDGHTATNLQTFNTLEKQGGGVVIVDGAMISNCIISACSSDLHGGGVLGKGLGYILDSTIEASSSGGFGGGCYANDRIFIKNSTFDSNRSPSYGGGICMVNSGVIEKSVIVSNYANSGGGVYLKSGSPNYLLQSIIKNNTAHDSGGGIVCLQGTVVESSLIYNNNAVIAKGGGIYLNGGVVQNCTVVSNSSKFLLESPTGSGIYYYTDVGEVYNSIVYYNSDGYNISKHGSITSSIYCANSCVTPDPNPSRNNITNMPLFADMASDNYSILSNSPCIDAGTNITLTINKDVDGEYRPMDGDADGVSLLDIGSYEVANLQGDSDEDGMSDGNEGVARTDPFDANDYFHIVAVSNLPTFKVYFDSSSTRYYTLFKRSDLIAGDWVVVPGLEPRAGIDGRDVMSDTNSVTGDFYRLKVEK